MVKIIRLLEVIIITLFFLNSCNDKFDHNLGTLELTGELTENYGIKLKWFGLENANYYSYTIHYSTNPLPDDMYVKINKCNDNNPTDCYTTWSCRTETNKIYINSNSTTEYTINDVELEDVLYFKIVATTTETVIESNCVSIEFPILKVGNPEIIDALFDKESQTVYMITRLLNLRCFNLENDSVPSKIDLSEYYNESKVYDVLPKMCLANFENKKELVIGIDDEILIMDLTTFNIIKQIDIPYAKEINDIKVNKNYIYISYEDGNEDVYKHRIASINRFTNETFKTTTFSNGFAIAILNSTLTAMEKDDYCPHYYQYSLGSTGSLNLIRDEYFYRPYTGNRLISLDNLNKYLDCGIGKSFSSILDNFSRISFPGILDEKEYSSVYSSSDTRMNCNYDSTNKKIYVCISNDTNIYCVNAETLQFENTISSLLYSNYAFVNEDELVVIGRNENYYGDYYLERISLK